MDPKWTTKYPHSLTLINPNQTFPTGWLSTDSVHYETCPRCGAKPGYLCVTPSGRQGTGLTGGAHGARMSALATNRPDIARLARLPMPADDKGKVIG